MESLNVAAFFTLLSLLLFANTVDARREPGEYWKTIMKDQPMPEAIEGLIIHHQSLSKGNSDVECHDDIKQLLDEKSVDNDFEPRPNVSVYNNDADLKGDKSAFVKDFEPRPNVSIYHDDADLKGDKSAFVKDFEPRPDTTVYEN